MHWGRHFELEARAARVRLGTRRPKITHDPRAAQYRKALTKKKKSIGHFDKTYEIRCKQKLKE